jgi:hypothetical protein
MPEVIEEKVVTAKPDENRTLFNVTSNPFSDEGGVKPPAEQTVTPPTLDTQTVTPPVIPPTEETVDADEFLTKETGWKTWDEAKAAKAELDELKKLPKSEQAKFTPEEREKLFEDAYPILQSKKQLERVEKLDATKPKDAAEIIKLDLALKNKDLTQDDVDFIFSEKYEIPDKPKKTDDQDDDDYAAKVAKWESQVERINRRLSVDAKLAKPELSKFKSELVLPDIPKFNQQPEQPTQESLDAVKAIRDNFLRAVDTDFAKYDGFSTTVKDESVEYQVSFKIDDKDKAEIKKLAQEMNIDDYFGKRWFDEKGNTKVEQMMSDLYFLEKREKAIQGVANNAASERRKEIIKQNSNIKLNGVTTKVDIQRPPELEKKHKEEAAIWSA